MSICDFSRGMNYECLFYFLVAGTTAIPATDEELEQYKVIRVCK